LAAENAASSEVKQFGQRMVDDHGKANAELKGLASQKNVVLPTELDAKHKAMQDGLSKLKGPAFDDAYMAHMASAHKESGLAIPARGPKWEGHGGEGFRGENPAHPSGAPEDGTGC
jgi:predicted outer membrane protein